MSACNTSKYMDSTVPIIRMKELKELFSSFPNAIGRDVLLVNDLDGKLVYNDTSVQVDAFAFAVFTSGTTQMSIETKNCESTPGTMLLYTPLSMVQIRQHKDVRMRLLIFDREVFATFSHSLDLVSLISRIRSNNMIIYPSPEQLELVNILLDSIDRMIRLNSANSLAMVGNTIYSLFLTIENVLSNTPDPVLQQSYKNRPREMVEAFIHHLTINYKEERTVKFYAQKLCLNPKYFSAMMKKITGQTAAEVIDIFVILEIKKRLQYSSNSIQQIGIEFNFKSQSFFGRYFKKHTGLSPSEYRIESQKNPFQSPAE